MLCSECRAKKKQMKMERLIVAMQQADRAGRISDKAYVILLVGMMIICLGGLIAAIGVVLR